MEPVQENYLRVVNLTGSTIPAGGDVYVDGRVTRLRLASTTGSGSGEPTGVATEAIAPDAQGIIRLPDS
jgi:hypothetical protein